MLHRRQMVDRQTDESYLHDVILGSQLVQLLTQSFGHPVSGEEWPVVVIVPFIFLLRLPVIHDIGDRLMSSVLIPS